MSYVAVTATPTAGKDGGRIIKVHRSDGVGPVIEHASTAFPSDTEYERAFEKWAEKYDEWRPNNTLTRGSWSHGGTPNGEIFVRISKPEMVHHY